MSKNISFHTALCAQGFKDGEREIAWRGTVTTVGLPLGVEHGGGGGFGNSLLPLLPAKWG